MPLSIFGGIECCLVNSIAILRTVDPRYFNFNQLSICHGPAPALSAAMMDHSQLTSQKKTYSYKQQLECAALAHKVGDTQGTTSLQHILSGRGQLSFFISWYSVLGSLAAFSAKAHCILFPEQTFKPHRTAFDVTSNSMRKNMSTKTITLG